MDNISKSYPYGQETHDRSNFAEYQQLRIKKSELEANQKILSPDSIWFAQNKSALKKIDERLDELLPCIPEIYFHPESTINKGATGGENRGESLQDLSGRITSIEDAIRNCGPNQDLSAMRRDLEKLRDEYSIKRTLNQPQRTDRAGKIG